MIPMFYEDLIECILKYAEISKKLRSTWITEFCQEFIDGYILRDTASFSDRRKVFKLYCDTLDRCKKSKNKSDLIKEFTEILERVYPYHGYEYLSEEFNKSDFDTSAEFLEYLKEDPSNAEKFTVRHFLEFSSDYISGSPIKSVDWSYACKPFTVQRVRY